MKKYVSSATRSQKTEKASARVSVLILARSAASRLSSILSNFCLLSLSNVP
ncbi:MAG: hypothetical protein LBD06_01320 [Candidatus Accumulibacter sp.]|nr:hypothetical protein [Accumulibacter sp.]